MDQIRWVDYARVREEIDDLQAQLDAVTKEEPVAKVELMTTGGNAGLATRIVEIDDHLRERLRPGQLLYTAPPTEKTTGNLVHIKLNIMKTALENIAGIRPIVDNLLSDRDIARIALERIARYEHPRIN